MKLFHPTYPHRAFLHEHANGSISEYAAIRHGDLAFQISSPLSREGADCHLKPFCQYLSRDCSEAS